jgi:hypothetical protein
MSSNNNQCDHTIIKKRGRKSKKDLENKNTTTINYNNSNENIIVNIDEDLKTTASLVDEFLNSNNKNEFEDYTTETNCILMTDNNSINDNKQPAKKRGRKPKGGKIIQQNLLLTDAKENRPNVILHLKCFFKDLNDNKLFSSDLDTFNFSNANLSYNVINKPDINNSLNQVSKIDEEIDYDSEYDDVKDYNLNKNNDIREIWKKLKVLEQDLHLNNVSNKKCACFHDTCDFDNPPIYIPKYFMNETYHVYGCFCSPECAVAYLMKEPIDTSTKFERYYLLNHIYCKIFEYNKNIKPAADPFYMLEKFYGNLTIQEYRALLRNERLFLVVDKPLTRIMPELHEDNDDFIINNKIIPSNTYQIKKRMQKKQTKNNILNEHFGISTN